MGQSFSSKILPISGNNITTVLPLSLPNNQHPPPEAPRDEGPPEGTMGEEAVD